MKIVDVVAAAPLMLPAGQIAKDEIVPMTEGQALEYAQMGLLRMTDDEDKKPLKRAVEFGATARKELTDRLRKEEAEAAAAEKAAADAEKRAAAEAEKKPASGTKKSD